MFCVEVERFKSGFELGFEVGQVVAESRDPDERSSNGDPSLRAPPPVLTWTTGMFASVGVQGVTMTAGRCTSKVQPNSSTGEPGPEPKSVDGVRGGRGGGSFASGKTVW